MLYRLSYSRIWLLVKAFPGKSDQKKTKPITTQLTRGESRIRTYEGVRQQIYSLPQLATLVSPHFSPRADGGIRTHDQLITNQLLWPTELHRQ